LITTVVGSYPKVPDLPAPGRWRAGVEKLQRRQITPEAFREIEDEVTREAITEQLESGLDLITDGQIRWEDGQTYFARRMTGFSIKGLQRWFDTNVYYREPVCEGEVAWQAPITVTDYRFATSHSNRPVKPVVTGPYTIARLSRNRYYATFAEFVMALARALNRELRALAAQRPPWIQIDEPAITQHKHDLPLFADAIAALVEGVEAPLALYTYFGDVTGIYPRILDLPFRMIGLDFVAGHRNWEALEAAGFPDNKNLGFGVLDARNTRMETVDEVRTALDRISRVASLDRIHLSPSAGLEFLPRRVARAKVERLVEVKRLIEGVTA
jgi:5-methyltetrahydropteroyltriglutamate--homocysteine methyltransferase